MAHPLIIALVVVIFAHDGFGPFVDGLGLSAGAVWMWTLAPLAVVAATAHLYVALAARRLDRDGSSRRVRRAERAVLASQLLATLLFAGQVLALGWLETVRAALGDVILLDEAVALTPPLLVFLAGWMSFYRIDRRLHEAMLLRSVEAGEIAHPPPTFWQYVVDKLRHQALLGLVPLAMIVAWSECAQRLHGLAAARWPSLAGEERAAMLIGGAQLLGLAVVIALAPLLIRALWSTVKLRSGPMRDRLAEMCERHGVTCRAMLVWRTHGMMLNGAVVGLVAPLRYILLTDALLERMPPEQIEAVMAHELGHVRRRHLPWMIASLGAALGVTAAALSLPLDLAVANGVDLGGERWRPVIEGSLFAAALIVGLLVFGAVSRLFERQADAFAVQHLSGLNEKEYEGALIATEDAANTMADALGSVARLNHIPPERFTWRHGSIGQRQRRILALIGLPLNRFPVDAKVRRVKLATLAALAAVLIVGALQTWARAGAAM